MTEITPRWEWRSFGKCFGVAEERLAYLARHGIVISADQSAKTKTALEFFSARLRQEEMAS